MVKIEGEEGKVVGSIPPANKKLTNYKLTFSDQKKSESMKILNH